MDERLNLVRRAVRRKPGAFETLMEQEKEYLYKMAFLYCREEQMALDTVAETVAKAYVGIGKLKKPEYFRTWLTRILINEALRAKEKSGTWLPWEEAVLQKENSMAPIREYSREEIMDLRDALQRLPEDFRELVLMKYFYEFSVKEISEMTGSSEGAVRTRDSSRTAQPEAFADMQDARYCLIGQQVWNLEIPVSIDGTRTQRYTVEQTGEKGFGLEEILVSPYDIKVKQIRPQMDSQEKDTFYLECLKKLKEITGIDGYATYEEDKHLGLEHPLDSTLLAFDQDGEPLEWAASSGMEGYDVFSTKQKKITRLYLYQLPDFGGYTVMKDQENARKLALFSYELEIREEP